MRIVDGQAHLAAGTSEWIEVPEEGLSLEERRRRGRSHWKPDEADLIRLMDEAGVDSALLTCSLLKNGRPDHGPSFAAAQAHPTRFAVLGRLLLKDPESDIHELRSWTKTPGVLGLRMNIRPGEAYSDITGDEDLEWLWDALASLNMPVSIYAPGHVHLIGQIATNFPNLRIVIDHMGIGSESLGQDLRPVIQPVLDLARFDNVAVKASALPAVTTEPYPFNGLKPLVRETVADFGAHRVFWGADISRLPCTYRQMVHFFLDELDFLSEDELLDVMGAGFVRWMNWETLLPLI